jgi:hypothetical protein
VRLSISVLIGVFVGMTVLASPAAAATLPSMGCGTGSAIFVSADNSGTSRSITMQMKVTMSCGSWWYKTQYKVNFGPDGKSGFRYGITSYGGTVSGPVTYYFRGPKAAYGAWVWLCSASACNTRGVYLDNPAN